MTQDFPTSWRIAIIVPVAKPGKVLTDPGSYRPIALTSCLCKTMERMVNSRLTWYLERDFLSDRYFKVRVGNIYTLILTHIRQGVPQGNIITVTLFSLKINSIVSCLLPDIKCPLCRRFSYLLQF